MRDSGVSKTLFASVLGQLNSPQNPAAAATATQRNYKAIPHKLPRNSHHISIPPTNTHTHTPEKNSPHPPTYPRLALQRSSARTAPVFLMVRPPASPQPCLPFASPPFPLPVCPPFRVWTRRYSEPVVVLLRAMVARKATRARARTVVACARPARLSSAPSCWPASRPTRASPTQCSFRVPS